MRVLVCDDDSATRFVIRRVLEKAPGCRASECADGLEALQLVTGEQVDLLILDIQMPTLDGLEVLEALRRSARFRTLPVIVLTSERRKEMVTRLVELGILGYVLKPLKSERLLPLVHRAASMMKARRASGPGAGSVRLDEDTPALLVDGRQDYCDFFKAYAEPFGMVITASSGLEALALFKRTPVSLVFVGEQLGVISGDVLVPKLRAMSGGQPLTVVAVRDNAAGAAAAPGYDDVILRTCVGEDHQVEMRRFIRATRPIDAVSALVGDLDEALTGAATQVFGMMLDSDVERSAREPYQSDVHAAIDVQVEKGFVVTITVYLSTDDARRIAARKLSSQPEAMTGEEIEASASELATLLAGRLVSAFEERHVPSTCSTPRFERHDPAPVPELEDTLGLQARFVAGAVGATFVLALGVTALPGEEQAAGSDRAA